MFFIAIGAAAVILALIWGVLRRHKRDAPTSFADIALQSIGEAVITTDRDNRVRYLNVMAERLTGWQKADALGQPLAAVFNLISATTNHRLQHPAGVECLAGPAMALEREALLVRKDGMAVPIENCAVPIPAGPLGAAGNVLVFRDASEARALADTVQWHLTHDALTGLDNRIAFERKLHDLLLRCASDRSEHILLYIDLDQFKIVNDAVGHGVGDRLLCELATRLRTRIRKSDILARLGGDEFGVLLENCNLTRGREIAEALRILIQEHRFVRHSQSFEIGASIGLVALNADSKDVAQALSAADAACYVAKDKGRNRIQEYSGGSDCADKHDEMRWVLRISEALAQDRFALFYQTIVPIDAKRGLPPKKEVLLRMLEDDGSFIEPMRFIPAAEQYNLITAIDRWVVRRILQWLARSGPSTSIWAINLSGKSICNDDFLGFVISEFAATGVDPHTICFEITETAAIANFTHAERFITQLKRLGCLFALDDFGSGMSSYAYLKNLAVDFIKIDGAFVQHLASDPIDRVMVESFNRIAHIIGIRTIAECVESEAILAELGRIGVDYGQGFNLHRPEPLMPQLPRTQDE